MAEVMRCTPYWDGVRLVVNETAGKEYRCVDLGTVGVTWSIERRYAVNIYWPIVIMTLTEQKFEDHEADFCRQFGEERTVFLEVRIVWFYICQSAPQGASVSLTFMSIW